MESKNERLLRYFLIILFVSITAGAFYYKYSGFGQVQGEKEALVVVVKASSNMTDNPIVIMYDYKNEQHILAQYEIEINNGFRFKTLEAIELKKAASRLEMDSEFSGVWVEMGNSWHYFDQNLKETNRSIKHKISSPFLPISQKQDKNGEWVELTDGRKIKVEKDELVKKVMSLSVDGDLLLILTNYGVKISTIDTK